MQLSRLVHDIQVFSIFDLGSAAQKQPRKVYEEIDAHSINIDCARVGQRAPDLELSVK